MGDSATQQSSSPEVRIIAKLLLGLERGLLAAEFGLHGLRSNAKSLSELTTTFCCFQEEQDSQEISPNGCDGTIPSTIVRNFSSHYVKLNVGGCLFYTAKSTLVKLDNMLSAMFSGRMDLETDPEG